MIKPCPLCKEPIEAQAISCPHCERSLQDVILKAEPEFSPAPSPAVRGSFDAWRRQAVIGCVLAVGLGVGWMLAHREGPRPDVGYSVSSGPVAPYRTTAADLYANFTAYEAATRGEPPRVGIELSGTIKSVGRTMFSEPEIHLDAGAESKVVAVTLDQKQGPDELRLIAGRSVTVRCDNMSLVLAQPTGQNCRLVD